MRTRHPFADVTEREAPEVVVVVTPEQYARLETELAPKPLTERFATWHTAENRRQRRRAVATFSGPKEFGKGLRRKLVKQRQRNKLGKMKGKET